jgi:hypothetical protein
MRARADLCRGAIRNDRPYRDLSDRCPGVERPRHGVSARLKGLTVPSRPLLCPKGPSRTSQTLKRPGFSARRGALYPRQSTAFGGSGVE